MPDFESRVGRLKQVGLLRDHHVRIRRIQSSTFLWQNILEAAVYGCLLLPLDDRKRVASVGRSFLDDNKGGWSLPKNKPAIKSTFLIRHLDTLN